MYNIAHIMTDHTKSCEKCEKWVKSGNYGNNPPCPTGQEIRAHRSLWGNIAFQMGE